jgi:hypothetical protein
MPQMEKSQKKPPITIVPMTISQKISGSNSSIQRLKEMPTMAKKMISTVSAVLMASPCFSFGAESRTRAR